MPPDCVRSNIICWSTSTTPVGEAVKVDDAHRETSGVRLDTSEKLVDVRSPTGRRRRARA